MRFFALILLILFVVPTTAQADWRWAQPSIKPVKPKIFDCKTSTCKKKAKHVAKLKFKLKTAKYHYKKEREWTRWTNRYIPPCTWYGESGPGPEFARYRYTLPNSSGSGALGKFQMMPGTYHSQAKYHDWSALDQEIAARREYWVHGTAPWEAC